MRCGSVVGVGIATLCLSGAAFAAPLEISFRRITSNTPQNVASQFKCVLSDFAPGMVSFRFTNNVGIASSISEVYFDDGTLLGISSLSQSGCAFVAGGASPPNLPGGQNLSPPFQVTQGFLADAQGNPSVGINTAADWLEIRFNLINNKTFQDTVNALATGELRIGLHVRSIGPTADSDSFVNDGTVIPLPPAAWAGLSGLVGLGVVTVARRRRAR